MALPSPTDALDSVVAGIRGCRRCIERPDGRPLPHQPRPVLRVSATARICVAGQAPGTRVHASGVPFTDPSGDRLRQWMGIDAAMFYNADRIAIVPMGFCFPGLDAKGGDLPPRRECAPLWREQLLRQMPAIELLLAVGLYAQRWHLGPVAGATLTRTVANFAEIGQQTLAPRIMPLPHPSWRNNGWIAANPWFESDLLPVLRAEVARILCS